MPETLEAVGILRHAMRHRRSDAEMNEAEEAILGGSEAVLRRLQDLPLTAGKAQTLEEIAPEVFLATHRERRRDVRKVEDGLEITLEELARSCFRVWCVVTGSEGDLDDRGADEQGRWMSALRWARLTLPGFDGRPVGEAVTAFLDQWAEGDDALRRQQDAYRNEWEAVVRHLACLLDTDELEDESDVLGLERSWQNWMARRPRRVVGAG